jgi:hypothetical protein
MAWKGSARFDYQMSSILIEAPIRSGIFVIYKRDRCIFVGEAGDIRGRLMRLLDGDIACIAENQPTHFAFELADADLRALRCREVIADLNPVCD